jgi:hypothetical protein
LAFHPYPQVIPPVCNPDGFGPPRACSARFTLPMGRSLSFGSVARHLSPFRTRVRSGSGCPCLNLATNNHWLARSTKSTPSQTRSLLRPAGSARFQALFHSPRRGAFTVPSRYWFPIGRLPYLALGRGRPGFPPDSACRKVLTQTQHPTSSPVTYGTLTPSGRPFQCRSVKGRRQASGRYPAPCAPFYPQAAARTGSYAARVWAPPVSLAATPGILSFAQGTEMFQFPQCPPRHLGVVPGSPRVGCPIRIPLDRSVPARPQSLSWRGHVLHRQQAPRHPPCAHLRGSPV